MTVIVVAVALELEDGDDPREVATRIADAVEEQAAKLERVGYAAWDESGMTVRSAAKGAVAAVAVHP